MQLLSHQQSRRLVCIGAHPDDIEIGCGGTLLKLLETGQVEQVVWIVMSGEGERQAEAESVARRIVEPQAQLKLHQFRFRDGYFPAEWSDIKSAVHKVAESASADIVFTHRKDDAHQDHRVLGELTWNAFRDQLIYEYEIPKFDADLPIPNAYSVLTPSQATTKIELLLEGFPSQSTKPWFDEETFRGLLRIRGLECHSPSRFAEAFICRKSVF